MTATCSEINGNYADTILEFTGTAVFDGWYCFWADSVGALLFAVVIFATITVGMIGYTQSLALPLVTGIIASVMIVPLLPGVPTRFFGGSLVLVITGLLLYLVWRLDRRQS